jgi:threonine dehydratase
MMEFPATDDLREARARIAPFVARTPLERAPFLERGRGRVFLKSENRQRGGAFKARGAFNAFLSLDFNARAKGVVAFSSGNHATAVALAARDVGLADRGEGYPCTVVMPSNAVKAKVARVRNLIAEVLFHGESGAEREAKAREIADETGRNLIPSYDDARVICGQASVGAEILEQAAEQGLNLSLVAGPVGGGGLMAGTSSALRHLRYAGFIVGVEPATANDTALSFAQGARVETALSHTVCDGLRATTPGEITFPILRRNLAGIVTVNDAAVLDATRRAIHETRASVEPSGAVCLAAWLGGMLDAYAGEGDVVLIVSGGNIDPAVLRAP